MKVSPDGQDIVVREHNHNWKRFPGSPEQPERWETTSQDITTNDPYWREELFRWASCIANGFASTAARHRPMYDEDDLPAIKELAKGR